MLDIKYRLTQQHTHCRWDNSIAPLVTVEPGDIVELETKEASDGQIVPGSSVDILAHLDFSVIHPLTGPVAVVGAEPGDMLEVEVLDIRSKEWGWTAIIPGFSLLADEFTEPYLNVWELQSDHAYFKPNIRIPLEPFCGVMGVALAEPGSLDTIPPRLNGGNIDIKQLVKGSKLFLPVLHPGALFSLGDTHAAQGDGEVCGTAIEGPMVVTVRFGLHKGVSIPELQYTTPGSAVEKANQKGYYVTTGHSPDLFVAAQKAVRNMIGHLTKHYDLTRPEAFALCSVTVDLRVSEIVDAPNWLISAFLPLDIFV
ncbi:MAG TPA: acetamidase/formamidase family protein [Ktedonobacteraceae bacterium]|nr:acetamidase/formamidase family protein [Ktedonobacteraceae bacterium]